ncbi:MAG: hypothetical protein R3286_06940, partial [Gammaproteobacteria bacterium]|nr:hypothetical protein [Gammaproteobacteria bacterium]
MAATTVPRPASAPDLPAILALLAAAGLPTEGVADGLDGFCVVDLEGDVIAAGGVEAHGRAGLLRSVV